jgi:antitoxin HigA-1
LDWSPESLPYFGNSAKFWLGLQDDFDLEEEIAARGKMVESIKTWKEKVA